MVDPSAEILVFNVSADRNPAEIFVKEMTAEQGWVETDTHLPEHKRPVMEQHGARHEECVIHGALSGSSSTPQTRYLFA